jgi:hypothetical protein
MIPPITFLEFVCIRLLGPPARRGAPGESHWPCPLCGHRSFHTLPVKAGCKDAWKCFRCGAWGDEFNLLRALRDLGHPPARGDYEDHALLLERWRAEYDRTGGEDGTLNVLNGGRKGSRAAATVAGRAGEVPPPPSSPLRTLSTPPDDPHRVDTAWSDLSPEEKDAVMVAAAAARREGVSVEALAAYEAGFREWVARADGGHIAVCEDPGCEWYICRLARGWTVEEIEADLEAGRRAYWQARRRRPEGSQGGGGEVSGGGTGPCR